MATTNWKDLLSSFNTITPGTKKEQNGYSSRPNFPVQESQVYSQKDDTIEDIKRGIIFTNTKKLAYKYFTTTSNIQSSIIDVITEYISRLKEYGIFYTLIDVSSKQFGEINDKSDFTDYIKYLDAACKYTETANNPPQALFIIGGHDVIPMARIKNPTSPREIDEDLENSVDSDLPYAYPSAAIIIDESRNLSWNALKNHICNPRFYVGRLPLESGFVRTTFEDDICSYFERALKAFDNDGMRIAAPLMTTCFTAKKVGACMTSDIPIKKVEEYADIACGNMFISPSLSIEKERPVGMQYYLHQISNSDMLVFLLHGNSETSSSDYYGQIFIDAVKEYCPPAFSPELLNKGTIKSIATVACHGAKFIDFDRNNSTLLSAIYGDTLCFLGSSRSAYGVFDYSFNGVPRHAIRLMKNYLRNLFSGLSGGESLSNAKLEYLSAENDYINNLQDKDQEINKIILTTLEFNFFGDPYLYMRPKINLPEQNSRFKGIRPDFLKWNSKIEGDGWRSVYKSVNISNIGSPTKGILERTRGIVDERFEQIQSKLTELLYDEWGLSRETLHNVQLYSEMDGKEGYILRYRHGNGKVASDVIVTATVEGKVISVYQEF